MTLTVLVIAGNKGIGFSLVEKYAALPDVKIIATARSGTEKLEQLSRERPGVLTILKLDVSDKNSIKTFGLELKEVAKEGIDIFIGNAGIGNGLMSPVLKTPYEDYLITYQVNVLGLVFSFKEAHDLLLLKPTKKAIFISSNAGYVHVTAPVSTSSYGASKAALNHICISLATELKEEGIAVVAVHPGAVNTEGNLRYTVPAFGEEQVKKTQLSVDDCTNDLIEKVFPQITLENSGKFFDITGEIVQL